MAKEARRLSSPELVLLAVQQLLTCLGGAARSGATAARATSFDDVINRGGAGHVGFATYIAQLDVAGRLDSRAQLDAATARLRSAAAEGLIRQSVCSNAIAGLAPELLTAGAGGVLRHSQLLRHPVGLGPGDDAHVRGGVGAGAADRQAAVHDVGCAVAALARAHVVLHQRLRQAHQLDHVQAGQALLGRRRMSLKILKKSESEMATLKVQLLLLPGKA